ncbi:helix-hairpin-helix domain-containing protein [Methylobacterium sp. 77]|uniref:ComEA family DNA-binding protein n=1 Tax=Methylobacterium sp. 77 TaxID=1101192 RepID=UPI0032AFBE80
MVVLFVVAAALAGLVQAFWPYGGEDPVPAPQVQRTDPAKSTAPKPDPMRSAQAVPERRSEPAPTTQPAPQPSASAQPSPAPQPILPPSPIRPLSRPAAPPTLPEGQANAALSPAPVPSGGPTAPLAQSPPLQSAQTETQRAVENAADTAGPAAVSVVDLNTGSLAELNGLKGGGMIGRAIAQRRPYASVDQLLSKRVLSRSTYDRIKNQVAVH